MCDHLAPKLRNFQHIGFVHRAEAALAFLRQLEGNMSNSLNLSIATVEREKDCSGR